MFSSWSFKSWWYIICRIQNLSSNHNQTTWQLNSPLQHQISCHHRAVLGSGSACFLLWPGPVAQHRAASQHCLCVVLCNNLPKETGAPASSPSPGPGLCNLDVVYRNLYAMYLSIRYRIHFECAITGCFFFFGFSQGAEKQLFWGVLSSIFYFLHSKIWAHFHFGTFEQQE